MKVVFWMQIVLGAVGALLQVAAWLLGAEFDRGFAWHTSETLLISGGFLWVHHSIVARGVK